MAKHFGSLLTAGALDAVPALAATGAAVAATGARVFLVYDGQSGPSFVAGSGEANDLRVTKSYVQEFDHLYRFDDVVPLTPGAGCRHPDPDDATIVECPWTEQATTEDVLVVRLGDLADSSSIDVNNAVISLYGGAGADRLDGRRLAYLYGEAGDDVLLGAARETDGGPGRDTITGGRIVRGGTATTASSAAPSPRAGPGTTTSAGQGGTDLVHGNSGDDVIRGGRGADELSGGPGNDTIHGNSGDDVVQGGPGRDTVRQ